MKPQGIWRFKVRMNILNHTRKTVLGQKDCCRTLLGFAFVTFAFVSGFTALKASPTKIIAADKAEGDRFGTSVSISEDLLAVGTRYSDPDGVQSAGAVYVYRVEQNGSVVSSAKVTAPDKAANDHFGYHVSLSGNMLLVGAQGAVFFDLTTFAPLFQRFILNFVIPLRFLLSVLVPVLWLTLSIGNDAQVLAESENIA